jgi:hypothetical protein
METAVGKCLYFSKIKHRPCTEQLQGRFAECMLKKVPLFSYGIRRILPFAFYFDFPKIKTFREESSPWSDGTTISCSTASEVGQVPDGLSMLLEQLFVAPAPPIHEKLQLAPQVIYFLYAGHSDYETWNKTSTERLSKSIVPGRHCHCHIRICVYHSSSIHRHDRTLLPLSRLFL